VRFLHKIIPRETVTAGSVW